MAKFALFKSTIIISEYPWSQSEWAKHSLEPCSDYLKHGFRLRMLRIFDKMLRFTLGSIVV